MDASRLAGLAVVDDCTQREIADIAAKMEEVSVPRGRILVREGEHAYKFFVVLEGSVSVLHAGEQLAALEAGDYFGEVGLLADERRNADVVAAGPAVLGVLTAHDFRAITTQIPGFAKRVTAKLDARFRTD